jgi:hypothetical protein
MTRHSIAFAFAVALAALIGIVHAIVLRWVWANLAAHSPVVGWLFSAGLHGYAFQVAILLTDSLTTIALSLPAAFALLLLKPRTMWLFLVVSVIPMFVWQYAGLIGNPVLTQSLGTYSLAFVMQLLALPLACSLLVRVTKPQAPNNSFKPTAGVGLIY